MSSRPNRFIPDPEEQAEEILRLLRDHGFDVAEEVTVEDLVPNIDPDKPVSVNLDTVAEAFEGTL